MSSPRRLAIARAARVRATTTGRPLAVDGERVSALRESWLVEDRWWTEQPLRRRYWELVSESGRNLIVYHDLISGGWLRQR
jgi:hypothetical protein